jgi:hypothetical protein
MRSVCFEPGAAFYAESNRFIICHRYGPNCYSSLCAIQRFVCVRNIQTEELVYFLYTNFLSESGP